MIKSVKSPYEIILENSDHCFGDTRERKTERICDALQKQGWYFTWCEQKYLKENENEQPSQT